MVKELATGEEYSEQKLGQTTTYVK